jgi:hypothetical protein
VNDVFINEATMTEAVTEGGWLVKIRGWAESEEAVWLFAVAETDPRRALMAVQKITNAAPNLRVETMGPVSSRTIRQLGLEAGQALDLTN